MYNKLLMYHKISQKLLLTCNFWVETPCLSLLETFSLFFCVTKYYFFSKLSIIRLKMLAFELLNVDWTQPDSSPQGASLSLSPQGPSLSLSPQDPSQSPRGMNQSLSPRSMSPSPDSDSTIESKSESRLGPTLLYV